MHYLHSVLQPEMFSSCIFLHKKHVGTYNCRYTSTCLTPSFGMDGPPELKTAGEVRSEMLYLQSHPICFTGGGNSPASGSSPGLAARM